MGVEANLNLAAVKQENLALRQECQRLAGIIEAMRAQDRLTALRAQFVAARLGWEDEISLGVSGGFDAADLFVERLKSEAEKAMAEEAKDEGTGDSDGDHRPVLVAAQVGNDGS